MFAPLRRRVWDSLRSATRARTLVLFYKGRCLLQEGVAPAGQVGRCWGLAVGLNGLLKVGGTCCLLAAAAAAATFGLLHANQVVRCSCGNCKTFLPPAKLSSATIDCLQSLGAASPGPICQKAMQSGTGNYLANLVLFPGGLTG